MSLHALTVPRWGLSMDEGTLASWLVPEGATIAKGQEVAEIETSKIANVLESPVAGVLRRHVAQPGEVKAVGALLGVIADLDEGDDEIDAFVADCETRPAAQTQEAEARPEPETATVEGRPFRFLALAPPGEASSARPVVLIHGFGGDHQNWMFNQAALAVDRPVYAIDLPGHGGSTKQVGDGSLAALAATVEAWMAGRGWGPVHLVGHSMGAAVAATIALCNPERVRSLVAVSGAGFGGVLNPGYVEGFIAAARRKDLKPVVEQLFAKPDLATREMLDDLIAYKRIDGVAEALRLLADHALAPTSLAALEHRLGEIAAPILRLAGEKDQVVVGARADSERIVAAGHMPHLEAADAVNKRIAAFLRDHD